MKNIKLVAFLILFLSVNISFAQTDSLENKESNWAYCQIVGTSKLFSTKLTIVIDYGQERKWFWFRDPRTLKDENGNPIEFNSMIDALNFMGKDNWEFTQAYVVTIGSQNVYHYLLKKKKILGKD